jgi:cobalamin biosynthesis protein CobT
MHNQGISFGSPLGLVINGLDDYWQETISVRNWGGAVADDFDVMHYDICMKALGHDPSQLDQQAMGALSVAQAARAGWADRLSTIIPQFTALCTDWSRIQVCVPDLEALVDLEPVDAAAEIVRIARFILDIDPDDDSQSSSPDEDSGDGKSGESDSEGEEGEVEAVAEKISYEELMHHVHSDDDGGAVADQRTEIVYDHEPQQNYDPYPQHEIKVGRPTDLHSDGSTGSVSRDFDILYNNTKGVSKAIARLFQSEKQTKLLINQKRGRPFRGLARVKSDPKNARPFFNRINALSGKADVYILIDCSGSMAGTPYESASVAAIHLSEALTAGGIPVRVCGFTEMYSECYHYEFKDWRERPSAERMLEQFKGARLSMNADGDSLMQAYREIMKHKSGSTRQTMIVLSDGSPSCNRDGDAFTYLQGVVKQNI